MSIIINIEYVGKDVKLFAEEMISSGTVDAIRKERGNLRYDYYLPLKGDDTLLLIDEWESQEALDAHHASEMMSKIIELRDKYNLTMKVNRYLSDKNGISEHDKKFIK